MKQPCKNCGHVHTADWTYAVGRFTKDGIRGYTARLVDAPLRATREEAEQDVCEAYQRRHNPSI